MENEIKKEIELLNNEGTLIEEGWARYPYWKYDRNKIKANKLRIKEWDYYEFVDTEHEFAIMTTFSDLGYAGLFVIGFVDYKNRKTVQVSAIKPLSFHKTGLHYSPSEDNEITFASNNFTLSIVKRGERRHVLFTAPSLVLPSGVRGLQADITFFQEKDMESVNIATSWKENRKCFYYNSKVNPMPVEGLVWLGTEKTKVSPSFSFGCLDWGRGRWTRNNTWYWASLGGWDKDGTLFGLNLGYGFTDRTPASENAIIYDKKVHKLKKVVFDIPSDYISSKWKFTDEDGRIDLEMTPVALREEKDNILSVIKSDQNQVFGLFNGSFQTDDGKRVKVEEAYGFAEKVINKW